MHISKDVARRFQGAINSLSTVSSSLSSDTRSAQAWSLIRRVAAVLCFAVLMFASKANAQATGSGSIQGVVTDPSGALIPNATVTLTEQSTQTSLATKSSSGGDFAFPSIHIGTYSLTVVAPGFQTYTSTGNVLEVGSSISLNAKMTVGSTDTKVEVRANGLALQTEDATFKQTVDRAEVLAMPLNNRYLTGLVTSAGGSQGNTPGDSSGTKFPSQTTGISIAGAAGNTVSWRLDGGDNNDYMGGNNNPLPFPDAIAQFSVETAALNAQSGTQPGGLVNFVTQSGTNTYHGSAFEFIRNNYLDASNFFSTCTIPVGKTSCSAKDTLHQNEYGGTFGGHILRNKLFAFAAFQHEHDTSTQSTQTAYVPTPANLLGDWSVTDPVVGTTGGCTAGLALIDPITAIPLPGNKYGQPGGPPVPAWNAAALNLLKYFPATPDPCGAYAYSIPSIHSDNSFDTRVDYTINQKNSMYARYFLDSQQIPAFFFPNNIFVTTQSGNPEIRYQTITLGENYVISSSVVNSAHLTGTRRQLSRGFAASTPTVGSLGVNDYQPVPFGIYINYATANRNHGHNIGGGSNLLATINDNVPVDFSDDVTWLRGKHQFSFGGEILRNQNNVNNGYQANGNFTFNGEWSSASSTPGDASLDLLQGAMSSFAQSKFQLNALRGWIPTLYAQDTFHATPSLTVTAGVRWQPLFFPHDYFHRGTTFNMAAFLANQHSSIYPNAPAGTFFYGDAGVQPNFTKNSPWQFNPNFAIAYDVYGNGKTVVRAGATYAYSTPNFFVQQRLQQNPPFSINVSPNTTQQTCFSDPWLINGNTTPDDTTPHFKGFGCGQQGGTDVSPFPQPSVPSPANATFAPQAQYIVLQSQYKAPNTVQWTASLQQQFPHGWTAQIFYTGNRTQHMVEGVQLNPDVYVPGTWTANSGGCPGVVTVGPAAVAAGTSTPPLVGSPCSVNGINKTFLNPATGKNVTLTQNQQARYALAIADTSVGKTQGNLYGGNAGGNPSLIEANNGYSNYNGVIVTVQHRFSSSFSLSTNYTYSKCLNVQDAQGDISGSQYSNNSNPSVDYGRCGQDVRNIFNASLILQSAFPLHGVTGYIVNNWQFAPLIRLVSGTPITVSEGQDESFTINGGDRPNFVPGVNPYNYAKIIAPLGGKTNYATQSYLNQSAFTLNTVPGTQGNIGRNSFSGPVYVQDDAQVSRIFPIYATLNATLRLEAFNLLNHPSFNNPSSGGPNYSGSFGAITGTSVGGRVFQGAVKLNF